MSKPPHSHATLPPASGEYMARMLLWLGVLLLPVAAGVVLGAVHAGYRCNVEDDDTVVQLLGVEFLLLPAAAATIGGLAGRQSLRARGRAWAVVGAIGGALASLGWGFIAFWDLLLRITDAAC